MVKFLTISYAASSVHPCTPGSDITDPGVCNTHVVDSDNVSDNVFVYISEARENSGGVKKSTLSYDDATKTYVAVNNDCCANVDLKNIRMNDQFVQLHNMVAVTDL